MATLEVESMFVQSIENTASSAALTNRGYSDGVASLCEPHPIPADRFYPSRGNESALSAYPVQPGAFWPDLPLFGRVAAVRRETRFRGKRQPQLYLHRAQEIEQVFAIDLLVIPHTKVAAVWAEAVACVGHEARHLL